MGRQVSPSPSLPAGAGDRTALNAADSGACRDRRIDTLRLTVARREAAESMPGRCARDRRFASCPQAERTPHREEESIRRRDGFSAGKRRGKPRGRRDSRSRRRMTDMGLNRASRRRAR